MLVAIWVDDFNQAVPCVAVALPWHRYRGIRSAPPDHGVVLSGGQVHGHGTQSPLAILGVGADGRIVAESMLQPGGHVAIAQAVMIVELPLGVRANLGTIHIGDRLRIGLGRVPA